MTVDPSSRSPGAYGLLGAMWSVALERLSIGPTWVRKAIGFAVVAAILYWIPTQFKPFQVTEYTKIMTLALAALGLNLLTGYTGQISVGHGAFFGIGAYTVAILVADHEVPHALAIVVAVALTFIVGVLVGVPALRIKGLYLALVTLALASLFPQFIKRFSEITGGSSGMEVPTFRPPAGLTLAQDQWVYYVTLAVVVAAFLLVRNLVRSRVGRALIAIRDNETAAETMGVNTAIYKLGAFGVSAMLAGLAGALSVLREPFVNANLFNIDLSITILVMVVIGGVGTVAGPIIGAYLLEDVPSRLPDTVKEWKPVAFAAMLVLLVLAAPGGIMGAFKRIGAEAQIQLARRRLTTAAPLPSAPEPLPS